MQIRPALEWLRAEIGVHRWALVGNDYIWPRRTAQFVREAARDSALSIEAEFYVPLATRDFTTIVDTLSKNPPDGVLMLLVGNDAVSFSRAFCEAGLTRGVVRYSPIIEENAILANICDANRNLYVSAGFFDTLMTPEALDFAAKYYARFGTTASSPRLNSIGESCYEALLLLREIASRTHPADPLLYETPRGAVTLRNNQVQQDIYIAQAHGYEFDILAQVASVPHR
jgi:urea transport system substrate-binding protein